MSDIIKDTSIFYKEEPTKEAPCHVQNEIETTMGELEKLLGKAGTLQKTQESKKRIYNITVNAIEWKVTADNYYFKSDMMLFEYNGEVTFMAGTNSIETIDVRRLKEK